MMQAQRTSGRFSGSAGALLGVWLAAGCAGGGATRTADAPSAPGTPDAPSAPRGVVLPAGSIAGGSALVIHSGGLDAWLVDPRDAGLRRALDLVDERLLELPAELGGGAPPPGLTEFLCEFLAAPWTLRLDLGAPAPDSPLPVSVRAQWTAHLATPAAATALAQRLEPLVALFGLPTTSADERPALTAVEMPGGSFFFGAEESAFVLAYGELGAKETPPAALGLPEDARPAFAFELDAATLTAPLAGLLAQMDESGMVRAQLTNLGLLGPTAGGFALAIGHGAEHAHIAARYRNGVALARQTGALAEGPLPAEAFALVPADATLVSLSRSEPLSALRVLEWFGPEAQAQVEGAVRAELGLELGADLLEPLGQTFGLYLSDTTGGGGLASAVMFVALDDEERFERTLDVLVEHLNDAAGAQLKGYARVREYEHRGTACFALSFPGVPVPFEPALAVRRGHLFAAATPQALAAALDHARDGGAGLAAHPALRAAGPLDDLQALSFTNAPRLARDGYGLAGLVSASLANAVRSPVDPLREPGLVLPPLGELLSGARPSLLVSRIEGEDLVMTGTTDRSALLQLAATLGMLPSFAPGIALLGTIGAVVGQRSVQALPQGEESQALTDVWTLRTALDHWAIEHMGRYPDSLEALFTPSEDGTPYVEGELPLDPWGNPYLYELVNDEPRVRSLGADGAPGGYGADADIDTGDTPDELEWLEMEEQIEEIEELPPEDD